MDAKEEKFFEELAGAKKDADKGFAKGDFPAEELKIELTKASAGVLSAATPRPKTAKAKSEEVWSPTEPEGQLTVDVYQTPGEIVIESAIAGVRPEDLDVNVTSDSISIRGARRREKTVKDEDYLYQECYWGRFARSIILPQEVDPENAEVVFKNGILTARLPKLNKKKSRKLVVKVE